MNSTVSGDLLHWIPYRLKESGTTSYCEWLYTGDLRFEQPFFGDTASQCKSLRENSRLKKVVSDPEMLQEWSGHFESVSPAAIIFHVSRCGSTLLSQLLALDTANIALSEVPLFDEILRQGFRNDSMKQSITLLEHAIRFYGRKRFPEQTHLFIKTDSWHIHFYPLLRQLFPKTPFILLFRRPDEVLRSQQKQRGIQAIPGLIEPGIWGWDKEGITSIPMDEYMAQVLESYYSAFLSVLKKDSNCYAFNYQDGMLENTSAILRICGKEISDQLMNAMRERCYRHAKYPDETFGEEALKSNHPPFLEKAFLHYQALEDFRLTHLPTS